MCVCVCVCVCVCEKGLEYDLMSKKNLLLTYLFILKILVWPTEPESFTGRNKFSW